MTDLIEKLEALDGPSREVDAEIAKAVGWTVETYTGERSRTRRKAWRDADGDRRMRTPDFTASIDAALTLVPEGWRIGLEDPGIGDLDFFEAWCWPYEDSWEPDWHLGQQGYRDHPNGTIDQNKASRAIALCIAALKAREHD